MRLCWDLSSTTHPIWVAHDCESKTKNEMILLQLRRKQMVTHCNSLMVRTCCTGWVSVNPHLTCLSLRLTCVTSLLRWVSSESCVSMRLERCIIARPIWGNCDLYTSYIDLSNFCHFLRNNDSRYCFFSCNRCSLRLKSGHLLSFRAAFIFLHRASKALSRAANSFMLVSWSRLLRNIHS